MMGIRVWHSMTDEIERLEEESGDIQAARSLTELVKWNNRLFKLIYDMHRENKREYKPLLGQYARLLAETCQAVISFGMDQNSRLTEQLDTPDRLLLERTRLSTLLPHHDPVLHCTPCSGFQMSETEEDGNLYLHINLCEDCEAAFIPALTDTDEYIPMGEMPRTVGAPVSMTEAAFQKRQKRLASTIREFRRIREDGRMKAHWTNMQ